MYGSVIPDDKPTVPCAEADSNSTSTMLNSLLVIKKVNTVELIINK